MKIEARAKQKRKKRAAGSVETSVKQRYAAGAQRVEKSLCCPVTYDPAYLEVLPQEIIEKDYGCGDPSRYIREGETVLDLGSGGGKICYIASQIVGARGAVIGVDFNPAMLGLARKYQREMTKKIGWDNVSFRWGKIQDLRTDLEFLQQRLESSGVHSTDDLFELEAAMEEQRVKVPLVADESVDVIVSNCVLNLVRAQDKEQLFREMFRVLKRGGRVAVSDIVADEPVPEELQADPELWSGCISGAFEEKAFLRAFENAGFFGLRIDKRDSGPWRVVQGIEFRSMTVTGFKGKEGECRDRMQAVMYKGPWKQVEDDDNHVLERGVRTAVCDKTFQIFAKEPYCRDVILLEPAKAVPHAKAKPFDCSGRQERSAKEQKKGTADSGRGTISTCLDGGCC